MSILNQQEEILESILKASQLKDLEELRIQYLGKNGLLTQAMKNIANLSIEEKKTFGSQVNQLKIKVIDAIDLRKRLLEQEAIEARLLSEKIDVTQPIRSGKEGKIHPITQASQEIINIFSHLGFDLASGPEIENDYYNKLMCCILQNLIRYYR